jgi:hypothetical protein
MRKNSFTLSVAQPDPPPRRPLSVSFEKFQNLGDPIAEFRIYQSAKSQNELKSGSRNQWYAYSKARERWIELFKQRVDDGIATQATEGNRRIVRFTREYWRSDKGAALREFDDANMVGGLKVVVDAMTRKIANRKKQISAAGILWDDSPKYFTGVYDQMQAMSGNAIFFEIWEVPRG